MATIKSDMAKGLVQAPVPFGQENVTARQKVSLAVGEVANGNVIESLFLPAGCVPVGYKLIADDLDSGTGITLDFGIINEAGDGISTATADGGDEWIDGSTLGQAAGITLDTASKAANEVLAAVHPSDKHRKVGVKIATAPTGAQAGAITVELTYRSAR